MHGSTHVSCMSIELVIWNANKWHNLVLESNPSHRLLPRCYTRTQLSQLSSGYHVSLHVDKRRTNEFLRANFDFVMRDRIGSTLSLLNSDANLVSDTLPSAFGDGLLRKYTT